MTLPEAKDILDGWIDYPPVYLMLKGIVGGLSGGPPAPRHISDQDIRALSPPKEETTPEQVAMASAGQLPLMASRPDPELKRMTLLDEDEMRKRNLARRVEMAKRKMKSLV
jgi:hypothetical protein